MTNTVERASAMALVLVGCANEGSFNYCPAEEVVFNEVFAASESVEFLDYGDVDWVELHNPTSDTVDLADYFLSRVSWKAEFRMPDVTIGPDGYLVLITNSFIDADTAEPAEHLVTGFDLNRDGDGIWFFAPQDLGNTVCDEVGYPDQHADFAWARQADGTWCDEASLTPGQPNTTCVCDEGNSEWC